MFGIAIGKKNELFVLINVLLLELLLELHYIIWEWKLDFFFFIRELKTSIYFSIKYAFKIAANNNCY